MTPEELEEQAADLEQYAREYSDCAEAATWRLRATILRCTAALIYALQPRSN